VPKTRKKSDRGWGHPCLVKVKFTNLILFGDRKNNVHKSGLACSVIGCTWEKICLEASQFLFWTPLVLGINTSLIFKQNAVV
jgi:hypothetical protein